jgi:predicted dehydrogenase
MTLPESNRITRRQVLQGMGAAVTLPAIVPSSVFGADAPSNRVALGVIGTGGKGTHGMRNCMSAHARIVAICDVNKSMRDRAAEIAGVPQSDRYVDFHEVLARDDIDAVLIATPDHWHVLQSIAAIRAGKDVYCEKPLSNTIAEGRALLETAQRYGAVFQHGTQLRSMHATRLACELVRNGYIGELQRVVIGSPPGRATGHHPPEPVPEWLDYDRWLGPAPQAPYSRWRCLRVPEVDGLAGWYFVSDYSLAGWVAGYGVHDIDIAHWGMGLEHTGPVRIEGKGVFPTEGLYDTVLTYDLKFTYANGLEIVMTDTTKNRHGVQFFGSEGWVATRGDWIEAKPQSLLQVRLRPGDQHLYVSHNHEANFLESVKTRAATITPIEVAHRSTSVCLLGGMALRLDRELQWDPDRERFVNDAQADGMLSYAMRSPWIL